MSMNEFGRTTAQSKWRRTRDCADAACVEVLDAGHEVHVRNSTLPDAAVRFTPAEWRAFLNGVKRGDFG
jgi:hypothetical protein